MAGKLVQVAKAVADGTSSTLSVTGIDSDNNYIVFGYNITPTTSTATMYARVTKSGTQDSTANYDYAVKLMNTGSVFQNVSNTNQTLFEILSNQVTGTGKSDCIKFDLYNFNSSSEYSFLTMENIRVEGTGWMGGGVHTVASASDGIGILPNTGNVGSGSTLVLYKVL
tara:strand:- start:33 stop:536 length:504 start_codon:yes stop_codon:yes gene_type:complete